MLRSEPGRQGLYGRRTECDRLERLLTEVRAGASQVLVLEGAAGIGKTALLEHLASRAVGCRVARATGVELEMELPYAGLHQLCAPFLDRIDRLPVPQRDALGTVFGLREGNAPDRFLIGLAVLGLLSYAAEDRPLVCLVDDAQWLDQESAQALAFAARRLLAESVAVVFATRDSGGDSALRNLPELRVGGLKDIDARAMLRTALRSPVDAGVFDEIVAEARGNPLALLELPRARTPAEIAFGFGLPSSVPLVSRMEQGFSRQLQPLPAETRRLLLVAAVEPTGDASLLWRAAERLGIPADAATAAEAAGLMDIGSRVRFRHPVLRSAVFHEAAVNDLREVHAALAASTADSDPDRRAWHRAQASPGPDEEIAAELERSAERARGRGGLAAAAAFLERATKLTPDPGIRAERTLAAATAMLQAGEFDRASELVDAIDTGPLDELLQARLALLRAGIAFAAYRTDEAPRMLLSAAARLEALDVALARQTYLDAFSAAMFVGRRTGSPGLREVAEAARRAPQQQLGNSDLILDGLAVMFTDGLAAAIPARRRAIQAFRSENTSDVGELRLLWLAANGAAEMWDDGSWYVLSARLVRVARDAGALSELPLGLNSRIVALMLCGETAAAASLVEEDHAIREATGGSLASYGALVHAAWQGHETTTRELIDSTIREVRQRGEGIGAMVAYWAGAPMFNGLGKYEDAATSALRASEFPLEFAPAGWGLVELIEATARAGDFGTARDALERLSEMTEAVGTHWALGVESRSRALLGGADSDGLYRLAIHHLSNTRLKVELARAHLLYGEWLRREGKRNEAREHLRTAHHQFVAMGVDGFGERARRELAAAGEATRRSLPDAREELTGQETEIARLAAHRRTNSEIGAQMFLSPRTVEWHLRKVFNKLGVSSRKELFNALPEELQESVPS